MVGVLAVVGYLLIGGTLGALAGYYGGWLDNALMRFTDIIISAPFLLVVIAITAATGGVRPTSLLLGLAPPRLVGNWPLVRGPLSPPPGQGVRPAGPSPRG